MMQLLAYFLLVEAVYGKKPPYGKLVYSNKTFKIRNTYKHRLMVKNTLRDMHLMLEGKYKTNETKSYIKCRNCICQYTGYCVNARKRIKKWEKKITLIKKYNHNVQIYLIISYIEP